MLEKSLTYLDELEDKTCEMRESGEISKETASAWFKVIYNERIRIYTEMAKLDGYDNVDEWIDRNRSEWMPFI